MGDGGPRPLERPSDLPPRRAGRVQFGLSGGGSIANRACECGEPDLARCRDAFGAALAAEFGDPAYFAVHHLTVAAYQVQHAESYPSSGAFEVLRRFLDDGATPGHMRREIASGRVGSESTTVRRPGPAGAARVSSLRRSNPVEYCADVERYARSVLAAARDNRPTAEPDR